MKHLYVKRIKNKCVYYNPFNHSILIDDSKELFTGKVLEQIKGTGLEDSGKSIVEQAKEILRGDREIHQLYMILTTSCNYACRYCRQKQEKSCVQHDIMSERVAIKAMEQFFSKPTKNRKGIVFYGGEPLLAPDLLRKLVTYVREHETEPTELTIFTNASLVDKDLAIFMAKNDVFVIVSCDGLPGSNDKLRVTATGQGTAQKTLDGFKICKENGCKVGFSMTIGAHNLQKLKESIDFLASLGPANLGFNLPHDDDENPLHVAGDNITKQCLNLFWDATKEGLHTEHIIRKVRLIAGGIFKFVECPAAFGRVVVMPDGELGLCEGAIGYPSFFSKADHLTDLEEERKEWQKHLPIFDERCHDCQAIGICGGGCLLDGYFEDGVLSNYGSVRCKFAKELVDRFLQDLAESLQVEEYPYIVTSEDKQKVLRSLLNGWNEILLVTSSGIGGIKTGLNI